MNRKSKYKLIIFDLDGTLLDTFEGLYLAVIDTVKEYGLKELPNEVYKTFIGPPIRRSFSKHYGLQGEKLDEVVETFRKYYKRDHLFIAKPYDGIFDVMQKLRDDGFDIAVATFKIQVFADMVLEKFGFMKYLTCVFGATSELQNSKAEIISSAIKKAGYKNEDCLLIGDSDNDAKGARDAEIDFLAVKYGFGFKEEGELDLYPHIGEIITPKELFFYL